MQSILSRGLHLVFGCLTALSLQAQPHLEALRQLPRSTEGFLLIKDPASARIKYEGLSKRFEGMPRDPWSTFLNGFGLERLPEERRGVVLAFMPDEGPKGGVVPVLLASSQDFKGLVGELKATTKDDRVFQFKKGNRIYLVASKGNWFFAVPAEHGKVLHKVLVASDSVMADIGPLAGWLDTGEVAEVFSLKAFQADHTFLKRGLWSFLRTILGKSLNETMDQNIAEHLRQAQREVTHLAFRAYEDEKGNLRADARVQLIDGGVWSQLGRNLPVPTERGLKGIPLIPYFYAGGGSLPNLWLGKLFSFGNDPREGQLAQAGMTPEQVRRFHEIGAHGLEGLRGNGHGNSVPTPGRRVPILMYSRFDVNDSSDFLARQESSIRNLTNLFQEAKKPTPYAFQREEVEGLPGGVLSIDMAKVLPPEQEGYRLAPFRVRMVAVDAQTILVETIIGRNPTETLANAIKAYRDPEHQLSRDSAISEAGAMLPDDGHFYKFYNEGLSTENKAQSHLRNLPSEVVRSVDYPDMEPAPPVALSLRFDLDSWEFRMAYPLRLQEALARFRDLEKAAEEREKVAMTAWRKVHPASEDED